MNDWDQQIQYHFENCAIFKPLKSKCVQILDSQSIPKATSVVSTILYLMFFLSFLYCGVCYSQVEPSISYIIVVQKSSRGDGKSLLSLLFWKEKALVVQICWKSPRKVIAPPIQCELFISTRTFLNNYDVRKKALFVVIDSTIPKCDKKNWK